jgi:hypothetical protein
MRLMACLYVVRLANPSYSPHIHVKVELLIRAIILTLPECMQIDSG